MSNHKNTLLQVTAYGMGQGDQSLSIVLIQNYFKLLLQEEVLPKIITFYNGGVKLLAEGSPVLTELIEIEKQGVQLLACKTCINHFELHDRVKVGLAGTMMDIIHLQNQAEKVITL